MEVRETHNGGQGTTHWRSGRPKHEICRTPHHHFWDKRGGTSLSMDDIFLYLQRCEIIIYKINSNTFCLKKLNKISAKIYRKKIPPFKKNLYELV